MTYDCSPVFEHETNFHTRTETDFPIRISHTHIIHSFMKRRTSQALIVSLQRVVE